MPQRAAFLWPTFMPEALSPETMRGGMKATLPALDMTDEQLGFGIEMAGDYQ